MKKIEIIGLTDIPLVKEGDNIPKIILDSLKKQKINLKDGDILVIAQTIVSKSNGQVIDLDQVDISEKAEKIYRIVKPKLENSDLPIKDPRLIQLILDESKEIVKAEHVLITETKHGFVCANAGIDKSNVKGKDNFSLLPENPDKDAENIRISLKTLTDKDVAIIVSDSFGRPFRLGSVGVAIGVSGIDPILDKRGGRDLFGNELKTTIIGQADNLASSAQLIMGEADEGIPITLIRGYKFQFNKYSTIRQILREKEIDLFRTNKYAKQYNLLKSRRSYKLKFESKSVDLEIVKKCINIARWAPSAHNGQFWRYVILQQGEIRNLLIKRMNNKLRIDLERDGKSENYINAKIKKSKENFLKVPILILLCLDSEDFKKYSDEERNQNEFIMGIQSISASATYLLLAFEMEKIASCWYCAPLFAKDVINKSLNLPDTYIPMAFFTVGYPVSQVKAPKRKSLEDIIYNLKL